MKQIVETILKDFSVKDFQKDLIQWYLEEKRDLPWRKDKDPYKVWVSEVMLQQTRVDTVIPYFNRFMEKYPTLESLAAAEEQELLKIWEGLGYYSRTAIYIKQSGKCRRNMTGLYRKREKSLSN